MVAKALTAQARDPALIQLQLITMQGFHFPLVYHTSLNMCLYFGNFSVPKATDMTIFWWTSTHTYSNSQVVNFVVVHVFVVKETNYFLYIIPVHTLQLLGRVCHGNDVGFDIWTHKSRKLYTYTCMHIYKHAYTPAWTISVFLKSKVTGLVHWLHVLEWLGDRDYYNISSKVLHFFVDSL